ncbi:RagB/SusD family nutrient uptake outer membrane protein [Marixanthomonas ophiurae]|uniref:RagB/SusD family nutrient uptake outer membrane protein n=1 Tax=Marixanthomonas ophiurae TaxID=387659 RepID=A0A3E1QE54_9FLAO|nr:RagB/SusD family nutrient uptake outer membrane protein [Marixanthomonas ophiurae]RFN60336.1 RagB/SusD family nutrient uptake outer membrane protein [Marixanthomonas ophiurae]
MKSLEKAEGLKILLSFTLIILFISCEDYLEVDFPQDQLTGNEVFNNEATATAVLTDMYAKLRDNTLLTGTQGLSYYMGLYADELDYYGSVGNDAFNFYNHTILPTNNSIGSIWNRSYNLIYSSNSLIEGVSNSTSLTEDEKQNLLGEGYFIRGFVHYYLLQLFGDIPYIKTTDYEINNQVKRMTADKVYQNIIEDLVHARDLLSQEYLTGERIRPNKGSASALLARVYLYNGQYSKATMESSLILENNKYSLVSNLDDVFLKNSASTIWQLKPQNGSTTKEGFTFIIPTAPPVDVALRPAFVDSFEIGDNRRSNWVGEVADGTGTYYFPFKYKQRDETGSSLEYSIVFRLAEQYLIRAEARAFENNLVGAKRDLNIIRNRAGLSDTDASTKTDILNAIQKERKFELFTEHGMRWFDLKRTGTANNILSPIKPGWKVTDVLFPLPENELLINQNLQPQNPGY